MKDYDYYKKIWDSPERYALVRNEPHGDFSIVDIIDQMFVLIEDNDLEDIVEKKLQEHGCKVFENIREAFQIKSE